jgi:hypothetical protein
MEHTSKSTHDIALHRHFVEALRRACSRLDGCPVGRVIAAGGVAFTLLRSGLGGGSNLPTRARHPWKGSRRYRSVGKRQRL